MWNGPARTNLNPVSPSSRRAWIEIVWWLSLLTASAVALLAEGVDRNKKCHAAPPQKNSSPSSRRAWIEIYYGKHYYLRPLVALLAEGVDRNYMAKSHLFNALQVALLAEGVDRNLAETGYRSTSMCRPPRGGRG